MWALPTGPAGGGFYGGFLGLQQCFGALSVRPHLPAVPTADLDWLPLLTTTAAAVVVTAAAVALHVRRDVPATARARRR